MNITLYLIEDDPVEKAAIARKLVGVREIEVIGDAPDANAALSEIGDLEPDVIVFDISRTPLIHLRKVQWMRAACPAVRILALVTDQTHSYLKYVKWRGAHGLALKGSTRESLIDGICETYACGSYIDLKISNGGPTASGTRCRGAAHARPRDGRLRRVRALQSHIG